MTPDKSTDTNVTAAELKNDFNKLNKKNLQELFHQRTCTFPLGNISMTVGLSTNPQLASALLQGKQVDLPVSDPDPAKKLQILLKIQHLVLHPLCRPTFPGKKLSGIKFSFVRRCCSTRS